VIILPDARGLSRFYGDLAERLVMAGYGALAIDYFGRTAGVDDREDELTTPHLMATTPAQVQADITAAREALADRTGATSFRDAGLLLRWRAVRFVAAALAECPDPIVGQSTPRHRPTRGDAWWTSSARWELAPRHSELTGATARPPGVPACRQCPARQRRLRPRPARQPEDSSYWLPTFPTVLHPDGL
jgi:hypothetical protein